MNRALLGVVALLPTVALGAAGDMTVSFSSGVVAEWTGKTLGIAMGFLPFLFLVSLMAEAAKPVGESRNFAAVGQRLVVIFVMLKFYGEIFGRLASMVKGAADSIATRDIWEKLQTATQEFLSAKAQYAQQNTTGTSGSGYALAEMANIADTIGGQLVDSVVTLIVLCGQAAFRIVGTLGGVLAMLLYVLGPLAVAASMPRSSDAGVKWLRVFISVLSWPLISAVLVGLLTSYALDALRPHQPYEAAYASIALAGILTVTAFAVPVVASALTGAGIGAVGAGWSSMGAWAGAAAGGAGAMANAAGMMAGAGQRPAAQAAGAAASAVGGGGGGGGGIQSSSPTATASGYTPPRYRFDENTRLDFLPEDLSRADVGRSPVEGGSMRADVAAGGSPPPSVPQQQQPPSFLESRQGAGAASLEQAGRSSPANSPRAERLEGNGIAAGGGAGLQPAPVPVKSAALPKKFAQAIENWSKAHPQGDLNDPKSRQEILQEHARLQGGAQGVQRGGGEPVTQRVLPQPPKLAVPSSSNPTKQVKR